ncbi:hypothetical protein BIV57_10665 [Mangrovactinospora gilvigrisea]|uniref:Alpha/beta hydrolase n=1 Tax=Mangrovactinospora gilvigrisea TaxID=1428644 RepID=A0A1J7BFN3_9ACTN|nr:hypothetical protein [Mangrovactinospora gilvigrisea]OIV37495.1 hypothetical protein BIV57_10665 [Mangrovactinospora gilvigrisea]
MTHRRRGRRLPALFLAALAVAGVAAPASAAPASAAPAPAVPLTTIGRGPRVVVLSNESDEDLTSWLPLAHALAARGYRAVLWNYTSGPDTTLELATVLDELRPTHARHIVLMGASVGAKTSIVTAARPSATPIDGVVSLSAEALLRPAYDVVAEARTLHHPVLLATSAQDPYGSADTAARLMAAVPDPDKRLVTVPGDAHGTALLDRPDGCAVLPAVLDFLRRHLH